MASIGDVVLAVEALLAPWVPTRAEPQRDGGGGEGAVPGQSGVPGMAVGLQGWGRELEPDLCRPH